MTNYEYLASPYSHKDPAVMQHRFECAEHALAWLLSARRWTYSPIVHCHAMAQCFNFPTDAKFWEEYNHAMIRRSSGLIVLLIDGVMESKGVKEEREFAASLQLPIIGLYPENETEYSWTKL